ncbi:MAG: MFS transporter [bacterium]|nr:MFS transporter [bacterium]
MNFRQFSTRYFGNHTSRELKELYLSTGILAFAGALISIFEPIYLYKLGFSLRDVFLFFGAVYAGYLFLLPIGGKIALRIGFEHSILLSTPFLILYYFVLNAMQSYPGLIVVAGLFLVAEKILYWPAFHAELSFFGASGERGREISSVVFINRIVAVFAPALGGVLLTYVGPSVTFLIVSFCILLSNVPLLLTPEIHRKEKMAYREPWQFLVAKRMRRTVVAFAGFGDEAIWYIGWLIFVFTVVKGFEPVGFIISGSLILGTFAAMFIGRIIDARMSRFGAEGATPVVRFGALLLLLVWIFRILLPRGIGIFLVETLDRIAFPAVGMPLRAMTYELARADHTMPTIVALEMALSVGKLVAIGLAVIVVSVFDPPWVPLFMIGWCFTLLYFVFGSGKKQLVSLSPNPTERIS